MTSSFLMPLRHITRRKFRVLFKTFGLHSHSVITVAARKFVIHVSTQSRGAMMRDELRDGYRCLKHAFPSSNQKSCKASPGSCPQLRARLQHAENETTVFTSAFASQPGILTKTDVFAKDQRGFDPGHTQQQRFSDPPTFYHSLPCSPFLHMDSAAFHSLFSALFLPIPSPLLSPPLAIHGRERPD
jgi:hypothetical protein